MTNKSGYIAHLREVAVNEEAATAQERAQLYREEWDRGPNHFSIRFGGIEPLAECVFGYSLSMAKRGYIKSPSAAVADLKKADPIENPELLRWLTDPHNNYIGLRNYVLVLDCLRMRLIDALSNSD